MIFHDSHENDMSNLTFGIIKPDAVGAGHTGSIIQHIVDSGFKIRGLKLIHMTRSQPFLRGRIELRDRLERGEQPTPADRIGPFSEGLE
jgi:hypothetical protein